MSMNGMPASGMRLSPEEMNRVLDRNRFSMQMLGERVGMMTRENVELMSIIQELQGDLFRTRQALFELEPEHPVLPAGMGPPQ